MVYLLEYVLDFKSLGFTYLQSTIIRLDTAPI